MKWRHSQDGSLEIDIGSALEEDSNARESLFFDLLGHSDHSFRAKEALVTDQVERCVPIVIPHISLELASCLVPLLENPFHCRRVAILSSTMNRQVANVVVGLENLLSLAGGLCPLKHLVEKLRFVMCAFCAQTHEVELVLAYNSLLIRKTGTHWKAVLVQNLNYNKLVTAPYLNINCRPHPFERDYFQISSWRL